MATYEELLEERSAFEMAGMTKKVAEWDFKIELCEIDQKYPKITFADMAREFNLDGLQKATNERQTSLNEEIDNHNYQEVSKDIETDEQAQSIIDQYGLSRVKTISESKMYDFIDKTRWMYDSKPEVMSKIIEILTPKLKGTAKQLFQQMFAFKNDRPVKRPELKERVTDLEAYIKIERVEDYAQNDNPPMVELMKLVHAKHSGIFDELYIAYPMVGRVKQIDPIFFGVKKDPNKTYDTLDGYRVASKSGWGFQANDELTMNNLNEINLGEMRKIAQWE
jgi:hypothetical protein